MTAPISTRLPSASDLQAQIDQLTAQLSGLGSNPFGSNVKNSAPTKGSPLLPGLGIPSAPNVGGAGVANNPFLTVLGFRQRLMDQIASKQKMLDFLKNPTDQSGVPPAPDAAPILGPTITAPKVGINDLKISLPR